MPGFGITLTIAIPFLLAGIGLIVLGARVDTLMLVWMGSVFSSVGSCLLIPCILHLIRKRKAKSGHIVRAVITDYQQNDRLTVNDKQPYFFFCEGEGRRFRFQSLRFPDPDEILDHTLDIYVSEEDPNVYYADEKSLR